MAQEGLRIDGTEQEQEAVSGSNGSRGVNLIWDSKCTGEKPCKTCQRAKIECRYEGIQRKRPRAVMLEERIGQSPLCFMPCT